MSIDIKEYHAQLTTVTKSTLKVAPLRGDLVVYKLASNRSHTDQGEFRITRPGAASSTRGSLHSRILRHFLRVPTRMKRR
jgi:hypothetical protein